ncbi:oxidoreductase [Mycolicibacterium moriokaense]|jgi:3-hydroxyisobutyrate dehydrogenase|uniref:Oxidoreductase n=1 Tax=Mycolicibacterium moriokaense TaxID=39691 RepID=A0AAD1M4Q4_9MYCO|nr:NAD(P)-dependent oxidoreductase [Mycolicibacterium moriokaense]MCV7040807.1 NAD(P)-dependent oxidoreductase [Mycolicibacterium moriokaense]ORB21497.1 oxidoreductase [Mycolicibacterium moriokaense]BBX00363.1 oxidoreductase [Mycolicibacterium moriokaense]
MDIGFIGLGNMGFPIACRLLAAGHRVVVFDTRPPVVDEAVRQGAEAATSAADVADRVATVMASLPTPQASLDVAEAVAGGSAIRRFVDFSTVGSSTAQRNSALLADHGVAALDSPVSGGVHGAQAGTLAVMVSGPRDEFDVCLPAFQAIGRVTYVSPKPGAAQTMKLVNNLIAASSLAVTAEAVAMGVKAGLDAEVMIDVLNSGSGGTHASRDKFPRAVLPRTFDYGFATGLMVKDIRLYLDEAKALGLPTELADTVARMWEGTLAAEGPDSDFTSIVKPIEAAAGVVIAARTP